MRGFGFGWAEYLPIRASPSPLVGPGPHAGAPRLGYKRIIGFPYFLFPGVLVKRIYSETDVGGGPIIPRSSSSRHSILSDHPLVLGHLPGPGCRRLSTARR